MLWVGKCFRDNRRVPSEGMVRLRERCKEMFGSEGTVQEIIACTVEKLLRKY